MSISDEPNPDILHLYEQKLLADEQMEELRQQLEEKDREIEDARRRMDHTADEYETSLQKLRDAETQVRDHVYHRYAIDIKRLHEIKKR